MSDEWIRFSRARNFSVDGQNVDVVLGDGRSHRVTVEEQERSFCLSAIVVKRYLADQVTDLPILTWQRNRATSLVGFRIDSRGRVMAEAWIPKAGVSGEEFQFYLNTIALEADRFEYVLTGEDLE